MASKTEEALFCPICSDVYRNPVILSCDHNFCHDCLWTFWKDGQTSACPLCKRRSSKTIPPFDFTLKTECDAVLLARASAAESELTCSTHSEKLGFFCLDDRQLVCGVCTDSGAHAEHQVRLVDEAGQELRAQLHDSLQSLKKKLRLLRRVKGSCDETAAHVKVQAGSALRRIQEEFRRLHRFLDEEEEARLVSLREEEEQKSRLMKEKIAALSRDISALSDIIKTTEEQLKAHNALFLQGYKETAERVRQPPADDPELASGTLIDVAKHLGNLSFNVWHRMKELVSYSPVILDPNTAHPDLTLSEELSALRQGQGKQELPDNPERVDTFVSVVGSEGFTSGRHSWEVEVGDNTSYVLGAVTESNPRKGVIWPGLFRLMFCGGEYKTLSPSDTGTDVSLTKNPSRVRVLLDYDRGQLSFLDADTDAHIHTFTHTFTERMFPYISTWSGVPIKIAARKISVVVEQQD